MTKKPSRQRKSKPAKRAGKPVRKTRMARNRPAAAAALPDTMPQLIAANVQALGLTIDPAWSDTIAFNLRLILRHAALIDDFALPDDAEPAPIFRA